MWIISLFGLMLAKTIYQTENWQSYYFHDAKIIADSCSLRVTGSASAQRPAQLGELAFHKVPQLPHSRDALKDFATTDHPFYHVDYRCTIDLLTFEKRPGLTYLHLGWVFADSVRILINGQERLTSNAIDKFVVPLSVSDLAGSTLTIDVEASGKQLHKIGMAGVQQPAIASGTAANIAIFGLDVSLQLGGHLGKLLPSLTLGLVLALAWMSGISTRILLAGFYFFVLSSTALMLWTSVSILPFEAMRTYMMGMPLQFGSYFGTLLIAMEVLGIGRKKIYPLMALNFALAIAGAAAIAVHPTVFPYSRPLENTLHAVFSIMSLYLIVRGWRASRLMSVVLIFFGATHAIDFASRITGHTFFTSGYLDLVLPLALATTILRYLQNAEARYRVAIATGAELSAKLEASPQVQALLLPARDRVRTDLVSFESRKKQQAPEGSWLIHWEDEKGQFHLLQGKVVGDGVKATVAAGSILAVIYTLRQENVPLSQIVEKLHKNLGQLFAHYVTTSLFGCFVRADQVVEIYNYGEARTLHLTGPKGKAYDLTAGLPVGSAIALRARPLEIKLGSGETIKLDDKLLSGDAAPWSIRAA